MPSSRPPLGLQLITIPRSDPAFRELVEEVHLARPASGPADLEGRLRRMFPKVVVRERNLSGEAPAWYVYRDGTWRQPPDVAWWEDPQSPFVVVSADGWIQSANATAAGIMGVDEAELAGHHFTDFIVPGTLDDAMALFRILDRGLPLSATVLMRPISGHVLAVELHAFRRDDQLVGVFRLADDVEALVEGTALPGPDRIEFVPATDVAFRGYARRAVDRMPEPTAAGLELRLRRLYPRATVQTDGGGWVAHRDAGDTDQSNGTWWTSPGLPRIRYDAQALIVEANEAAEAMLGRALAGRHWQEFVTPGSTEQVSIMLEILAEAGAAESRFRMPHADGRLIEFDSYTEVVGEGYTTVLRPRIEG